MLREARLILGVNALSELPPRLRRAALLIPDKIPSGALYEDALELAKYDCEHAPGTSEHNSFIEHAMG